MITIEIGHYKSMSEVLRITKHNIQQCTRCAIDDCYCIECCSSKKLCHKYLGKDFAGKCTWHSDKHCDGFRSRED